VVQINSCWAVLRKFGRGGSSWLDRSIEIAAKRVLAVARANEADELAVVGHSSGAVVATAIMARALELDPDLGRNGIRLVLLTLGSVMPAVALHPRAARMRDIVRRLAVAPALTWIDCQSRKDVMCFANFDPIDGVGVKAGGQRCNTLLWRIRFRDMIAPKKYGRFRWNHLRVHYQYILAGDQPAPYDYVLLVGGSMPIADWPERGRELMLAFARADMCGSKRHRDDVEIGACP
jgi:pimeloyl-ACP methyl ester carboxylesterase